MLGHEQTTRFDHRAGTRRHRGGLHVVTDPDRLVVYESDGLTSYRVIPRAVVLPASTEEVSEVVRLLHGEGIPVIPRGQARGCPAERYPRRTAWSWARHG